MPFTVLRYEEIEPGLKNLTNIISIQGTDEELEDLLQSQRNDLDSNEGDQRNCQRRIDALNRQTEKLNKEKNNLSKQQGLFCIGFGVMLYFPQILNAFWTFGHLSESWTRVSQQI